MKKFSFILLALAGALAVSCEKNDVREVSSNEVKTIKVSVDAEVPALTAEDGTKVTFSGENLVWEGDETMGVLFGTNKTNRDKAETYHRSVLNNNGENVFSGEITLTNPDGVSFAEEDMWCIQVPAGNNRIYGRVSGTDTTRFGYFPIEQNQIQAQDGVMNGDYFPLFLPVSDEVRTAAKQTDGSYKFSGVQLKWACSAIRFNVYGTHPSMNAGEVLQEVKIVASTAKLNKASMVNLENTSNSTVNSDCEYRTVTLSNPVTVAGKTKDDGVKLFMSISSRNSNSTIDEIQITTDKAVYIKTFDTPEKINGTVYGRVYQYGLNLANGWTRLSSVPDYSVDGGATWTDGLPSGTGYTTLAVKGGILSSEALNNIKTWIDSQASPVDLDLSAIAYEDDAFPAVFGNTTAADACAKIKSVAWPSNITSIAANAFYNCTGLESVDLTQINTLGNSCLRNTGLTDITVPSNVTSLGTYVLANNSKLASVYWACADPVMANFGTSNRKDYYTLAMANSDTAPTADLVVTIAPDTYIPRYFFRYNNFKKVIFEPCTTKLRIGNNSFQNVRYLKEIEIQGDNTALFPYGTADVYNANIGAHVATTDRKIILTGVTADAAMAQTASSTFYVSGSFFPKLVADLEYTIVGID